MLSLLLLPLLRRVRSWGHGVLVILALLALIAARPARAAANVGVVRGSVADDAGLVIPGVLLTLASPALIGGAQQTTSDDRGGYAFLELPPGRYALTAQKQGFGAVRKEGVSVQAGRTTAVDVRMQVGAAEVVIEEARRAVDVERVSAGTSFDSSYLQTIPSDREWLKIVTGAPGINGYPGLAALGGNTNDNSFLLDGVSVTDPVTGSYAVNFNYDAIEEIEVITGGFDPEYGGSLGATVSVVTRSGGNTLQSWSDVDYRDADLSDKQDARFSTDGTEISPTDYDLTGKRFRLSTTLSGPVVRDRVWFIGSYEYARTLAQEADLPQPEDTEKHSFFGKLSVQPDSHHRLSLQLSVGATDTANWAQDADYPREPEAQYRLYVGGRNGYLKWTWFPSRKVNLDTTASLTNSTAFTTQVPCTHDLTLGYNACAPDEQEASIDWTTPGRVGLLGTVSSDNIAQAQFESKWLAELSSKLSITSVRLFGTHDFKLGVQAQVQDWTWNILSPSGVYAYDIASDSADPDSQATYYWTEPAGVFTYHGVGVFGSAFVQDAWKPVPNLVLRGGLRCDYANVSADGGVKVFDQGLLQPRIYAAWDPFSDRKTRVYGGYGRATDMSNIAILQGVARTGYGYKGFLGELYGRFLGTGDNNVLNYNVNYTTELGDLSPPTTDQILLGTEREVIPDLAAKVEFTGKFTRNLYRWDESNLTLDEDGYAVIGSYNGENEEVLRLRTPSAGRRDYFQVDVGLTRLEANRWFGGITYTYAVSRGADLYANTSIAYLSNPGYAAYGYGNLATDLRHQLKAYVGWQVWSGKQATRLGGIFRANTGAPVTRYAADSLQAGSYLVTYDRETEERGTYARFAPISQLDLKVTQPIRVGQGALQATFLVENVLGSRSPVAYDQDAIDQEGRYVVTDLQSPRAFTLGVRYER